MEEKTCYIRVNVEENQHRDLKAYCALKGITLRDLFLKAVEEYLKKHK